MRRVITSTILFLIVVPLIAAATFAINAIWFKPFSPDVFFDRVFVKIALQDPELLSMLRVLEPMGIDGHNAKLTDPSDANTIDQFAQTRAELAILQRYDRSTFDESQRLSAEILEWYMQVELERERWLYHGYPVHQMGGIHTDLASFMSDIHVVKTPNEAEYYLARLALFPWKFERVLANVKTRSEKGLYPPRFTIERVIDQARAFREAPAKENILYTSFQERLEEVEGLDAAVRDGYLDEAADLIEETVYPEYDEFIAYYESLLDVVTESNGVWALPDGDEYYAYQLKRMTTTDLPPEEVHAIGVNEVARIEGEMKRILESLGFAGVEPAQWYLDSVNDPQFVFPNTEEGKQQALAEYQRIVEEAQPHLQQTFDKMPSSPVEVRRIPAFKEQNEAAHYFPPAMDGSRPGIFFARIYDTAEIPKYTMRTLTYHEASPGHHFQIALKQEIPGLPIFRRFIPFTAFSEGWALYAELLAREYEYYDDPYSDLGQLQSEMFRAVRLVVDTGIHYKKWSREQAIEYMMSKTGMIESDVTSEIERYFVMPGQACSYKIGMLKILELRTRAQETLGNDFDIKEFHNEVLLYGSLPLAVLEEVIDDYIAAKKSTDASAAAG